MSIETRASLVKDTVGSPVVCHPHNNIATNNKPLPHWADLGQVEVSQVKPNQQMCMSKPAPHVINWACFYLYTLQASAHMFIPSKYLIYKQSHLHQIRVGWFLTWQHLPHSINVTDCNQDDYRNSRKNWKKVIKVTLLYHFYLNVQ